MSYTIFDTSVIRVPFKSLNFFKSVFAEDHNADIDVLLKDGHIRTAIYLSSPNLLDFYYDGGKEQLKEKKYRKLRNTILKYVARMSTRSTPFGLLAGVGAVKHGETSELRLGSGDQGKMYSRLDMELLCAIAYQVEKLPFVRPYLKYHVNSTLYKLGDSYRYVETSYRNNSRNYELSSIEYTDPIEKIISGAKHDVPIDELVGYLSEYRFSKKDKRAFIDDLIDSQILLSELEPSTLVDRYDIVILRILESLSERIKDKEHLKVFEIFVSKYKEVISSLEKIDKGSYDDKIAHIKELNANIKAMDLDGLSAKHNIQVDFVQHFVKATLSSKLIASVQEGIDVIIRLSSNDRTNSKMQEFIETFQERYETREVSLTEALDSESGIGYGADPNESLDFKYIVDKVGSLPEPNNDISQVKWDNKRHAFWANKILHAIQNSASRIVVTEEEIKDFPPKKDYLNATFSVQTNLVATEGSEKVVLKNIIGTSASIMIGRFSPLNEDIYNVYQKIAEYEEEYFEGKILAELNHLSNERLGNVLQRSNVRKYQIPYLANSLDAKSISINELSLRLNNKKELELIDKSTQKLVIPYISNALNHWVSGLTLFSFLGDLNVQKGTEGHALDLGVLPKIFPYIPRIEYKNLILRTASWRIGYEIISTLCKINTDEELLKYWNDLREARKIPLWFSVSSTDNELVVYSKSADSLRLFVEEVAKTNGVTISEYLMEEFQAVEGEDGFFSNEVLFLFKKDTAQNARSGSQIPQHQPDKAVQRDFAIGDYWMYYKIYLGFRQTETALLCLRDAIQPLISKGYIQKFFFIRYKDPKFHVRFRIYAEPKHHARILKVLTSSFRALKERLGYLKIIQDPYLREIERYGPEHIEAAETIFYLDSEIAIGVLRILQESSSDQKDQHRWYAALYLSKKYLCAVFDETDDLCKFTESSWKSHADQLRVSRESVSAIDQTFNEDRLLYMDLLNGQFLLQSNEMRVIKDWIDLRFSEVEKVIKDKGIPRNIMGSIIHMSLNRLFRSHNNTYEFSVYQILKRFFFTMKNKK